MSETHISNYQLFALLVMHSLGSSTIFALGIKAKQDAWIVVLFGLVLGFGIIWIHTQLQKKYPDKNLAEIIIELFGRMLGSGLILLFAGYFIWVSTLNFSEFAELISITTLNTTPILYIQIMFAFVIVFLTFNSIEVIGRTSEILMPYVLLSLASLYILTILSGNVDLRVLQPVLGNGIIPVLRETYPRFSTFPYGEDVVFLMFYCYVNVKKDIRKTAFKAIFILGLFLIVSTVMIISVLGVEFAATATIPLIEVVKLINIGDIVTNLDAIGVIIIFIGGLFKAMLFFYGSVLALHTLVKINKKAIILFLAVFLVWHNLVAIPNFAYHRFVGIEFTNRYIHAIYTIYIPILLLIIVYLKKIEKVIKNK